MKVTTLRLNLIDQVFPGTGLLRDAALVLCFALITALCSQIAVWIGLVPVTGQTFAVLLCGALLGSRRGALSQITYIAVGSTGLPFWFALGGAPGAARLAGPTAGYLFGFVLTAFIVGWLCEHGWGRNLWRSIAAMLIGSLAYYACGLAWLSYFVPADNLLQTGLYPFVAGDLAKAALAALLLPAGWKLVRHLH